MQSSSDHTEIRFCLLEQWQCQNILARGNADFAGECSTIREMKLNSKKFRRQMFRQRNPGENVRSVSGTAARLSALPFQKFNRKLAMKVRLRGSSACRLSGFS